MRYFKILFFLIIFIQNIHAQDVLKPYKAFLPGIMKKNTFLRKSSEKKMDKYFKLNPELAAIHLQYLKLFFDKRISNPDSNLKKYEENLLAQTINRRSEWADSILEFVYKTWGFPDVHFTYIYPKEFIIGLYGGL